MRTTKWIIGGFAVAVAVIVAGMCAAFVMVPTRDANTYYGVLGGAIKSFDPAVADDTLASDIAGDIFECLYNYQYGVQPYKLMPELAADVPEVSADGLTYTIKLRKGIHFYDPDHAVFPDGVGPEVTARDFVYSWKRVANFYTASALYTQIFQGRVVGLDEWFDYTQKAPSEEAVDWDRPVAGLTAVDDYTLRVKLVAPYPQFKYTLAYLPTAVVCRKVVEHYGRQGMRDHPVGTGPYSMGAKDYLEEQRVILSANPTYRGRPDIDGNTPIADPDRLPHIKRIQLDYYQEEMPIWLMFQNGLFDSAGIPKESYHQAITSHGTLTADMVKKGIVLRKSVDPATYYVGFNWSDKTVGGKQNTLLRQAMSMTLNRPEYIEMLLNGRGTPAIGPIPPGFPTFDPNQVNPNTQYNLDAAKAKLSEWMRANHMDTPPKLSLLMGDTDASTRQEGEFIRLQMQKIGLDLEVEYRDWARFQDMVDQRQTQLFALGWVADYPDAQDFFQLFYSKNGGPGGVNPCGYSNPEFDALYEKASVMSESPARDVLYDKMNRIVMEDCPWLLEFYPITFSLYYDWLGNGHHMDYGYGMIQYETLDSALRSKRLAGHS
jgi:oligopeptide transport system substrate-binding protein